MGCDRLTVLHVFSGDLWAGAEVMIFNLLSRLKDYDDLRILALSLNNGTLTDKLIKIGVETHVIPEATHGFPAIFANAYRLLRKEKMDIIHSHRYKENLLALMLAKSLGVKKLVATLHGLPEFVQNGHRAENRFDLKTKVNYLILKKCFTCTVAVSQEMRNTLVEKYHLDPARVKVIYNGIPFPDGKQVTIRPNSPHFHIGTVGRMVPVKDFDLFLEVAAQMRRHTDRVRFTILGEGPLKARLIEKAKFLGIDNDVEFLAPVSDPTAYYESLDLYLSTSHQEGIPLSVLEAMANGKSVVAPTVGGIPEIISHQQNGLLVSQRRVENFVDSCLRLINDKALRDRLAENARAEVQVSFNNNRMVAQYHELYRNAFFAAA